MIKFGQTHDARGADPTIGAPVLFYEETACFRLRDLFSFWRKSTNVYILEGCKFTTITNEPYTRNTAKITIDGEDVYAALESMGIRKGIVRLKAGAVHNDKSYAKNGHSCLKDATCRLRLGFTDKKGAVMAKLKWGGSGLTW